MPPAEQVRNALERVLVSDVFARSERARDLLRYLVEQDLAGHADRLKGFSIAVDVFGKDDRFDSATDAVVRVQAGRLRELLEQFYAGAGKDEDLRIAIPRGSYVPDYEAAESEVASQREAGERAAADSDGLEHDSSQTEVPPPGETRVIRQLRVLSAVVAILVAVLGYVAYRDLAGSTVAPIASMMAAPANRDATGSVQPSLPAVFIAVGTNSESAARVAASLRRGIPGFDTVDLISREPKRQSGARADDFILSVNDGGEGRVHLAVENARSGRVLLSRVIAAEDTAGHAADDAIADFLTSVVTTAGAIYAYLKESHLDTGLTKCLMLNDLYYRDQKEEVHRQAYECMERLEAAGVRSPLVYSELASLHMEAITDRHAYPKETSHAQALAFARRALELGPNSPYAHRSYGYVISRTASEDETLRWARKAYELNTFDLGMTAYYGYELIFAGRYREGTAVMERAVSAASSHPSWWDYALFLGHFMLSDRTRAADAAASLAASRRGHYLAARLIVAHERGDSGEAMKLIDELGASYPGFTADPTGYFRRGNYPEDLTSRFVDALRQAGLSGAS